MSPNETKLKNLLEEILLIEDGQYRDDCGVEEIDTWDSLAVVRMLTALEAEFACSIPPEEMVMVSSIGDIKALLGRYGVSLGV